MTKSTDVLLALPDGEESSSDRQFITALARGLEILRAFEPGSGPLGNQEIAQRVKLPKATVARMTYTLTRLGYLEHHRRLEKYSLGVAVLSLGYACLSNVGIRAIARSHMQQLADHVHAAVALGSRDRLNMTYLEMTHGNSAISVRLDVGARIPIRKSAIGLAYLYNLAPAERDLLVDAIRDEDPQDFPDFRKRLDRAFDEFEQYGFCVGHGLFERSVSGVAAPLRFSDGTAPYALNCSASSFQFTDEQLRQEVGPRLVVCVQNIQAEMRHRPIGL